MDIPRDCLSKVYPRVGGGNARYSLITRCDVGLSPRGRGKPVKPNRAGNIARSIPAWAGETVEDKIDADVWEVYPRVGGGNLGFDKM